MDLNPRQPDPESLEDERLLPALRARDPSAYEAMVYGYMRPLMRIARRLLRDENEACEAVQDAFVHATRALPAFDGRSRLATWLHRIAVNESLRRIRSRRVARARRERQERDAQLHARTHAPPDRLLEAGERRRQVAAAIESLPEDFRVVVLLRDVEGLSTAEAAAILGVSDAACRIRLHRARLALKERLKHHLDHAGEANRQS
jgi:RNA polymerase sigma-70 factor, ECF subfamily